MFDDDDNNDDNDDDFVGITTNFYYLQLKIALSTVAVTSNLTIQPRTELRRFAKRGWKGA